MHTYPFAARGWACVAFEPQDGCVSYLRETCRLNGFHDVTIERAAVGEEPQLVAGDVGRPGVRGGKGHGPPGGALREGESPDSSRHRAPGPVPGPPPAPCGVPEAGAAL